ncbi:hypothetical protein TRAPUB_14400 [Trametes pubescens]|uniref:Carbohydrate-binding module family 19 domain-containing protein n=1 Tax=Trametes pubescens TaxID=154538 RepID=A0A1M2VNG7_TRAPU|nr:hypothetical protein TRAPUB_14400 [Trametes pubescens]
MQYSIFVTLALALSASASPRFHKRASFTLQNGKDAIALNQKFATLTANSPCTAGENACVNSQFAQCVNGKFVTTGCAGGLVCAALPLVNSAGTSITCTTAADRDARIAATGATAGDNAAAGGAAAASSSVAATTAAAASSSVAATTAAAASSAAATVASSSAAAATSTAAASGNNAGTGGAAAGGDDPQKSLTLVQSVIATGFENDGQDQPTAGQVPSLTSSNNFINFCATVPNLPITNGLQVKTGSCNPAPMGIIASTANMPSSKFVNPKNGATIKANTNFTIQMAISHLETGHFVNANENYFSAPQVVNSAGDIQGHSHVVIDKLTSLDQTTPTDPLNGFVFFKGLNDPAANGVLSTVVGGGLPAGTYRLASINAAANHQPALVAIAQHGSLDDMV